jgi:deoxyribose-phosphate aldolase
LTKAFSIKNAIANGAREIDAVMALGRFKSGEMAYVADDMKTMVDSCHAGVSEGKDHHVQIKIIIETHWLTEDEKQTAAQLVRDSGADFVKTSTGTAGGGATTEDIRLLRRSLATPTVGIKASGGIRTLEAALQMLDAGANRIGTSIGTALYDAYRPDETVSS